MRTAKKIDPEGNPNPFLLLVLWIIGMVLAVVATIGVVFSGFGFWTWFFFAALACLFGARAMLLGRAGASRQPQAVSEEGREGNALEALATVEVIVAYPPADFLYAWSKPNIVIDGHLERRPWGSHTFELEPGDHHVEISYPYLFFRRCGANSVRLTLEQGETRRVHYMARLVRFLRGTISVE